jgi:apolipoprotein N-acyltransferase
MWTNKRIYRYAILFLGLIAYTFAGLNWNIGIAAWIAPVLVLYFAKRASWAEFIFLFLGLAFAAAISKSAENLGGLVIIYITTGISYGIIYSLPYIIEKLLIRNENKFYSTLVFPSTVVFIEYLLSLAFGIWGNASVAHYSSFHFIQIASVFGIFGISFLVAWFASTINWIVQHGFDPKTTGKGLAVYGTIIIMVLIYGHIRTNTSPPEDETVKVASIVGETDIFQVFEEWENEIMLLSKDYEQEIPDQVFSGMSVITSQIVKTKEALSNGAKIVVWNEISLILRKSQADSLMQVISKLCMENQAYVLLAYLVNGTSVSPKPFNNSSILIKPDGEIAWEYSKYFLNPLEALVINKGSTSIPYLDTEYGRIGNAICADLDLSGYISQVGKESMDILLVPAFDWEEITPYHPNMAAFAAIQYGVSIIRSNGKGIAAIYDYHGDVLAKMNTLVSNSKITYAEIPVNSPSTVYAVIGNLFVYVLILFLLISAGLRIRYKE